MIEQIQFRECLAIAESGWDYQKYESSGDTPCTGC